MVTIISIAARNTHCVCHLVKNHYRISDNQIHNFILHSHMDITERTALIGGFGEEHFSPKTTNSI